MRKTILILVALLIFVFTGCVTQHSDESTGSNNYEYFYTREQCSKMESDLSVYLTENHLFYDEYMSIKISSGGTNHKTKETDKNVIQIIVDGRLSNTEDEVRTLAEGIGAALELYFGQSFGDWRYKFISAGQFIYEDGKITEYTE